MSTYRVFGSKTQDFYVDVSAASPAEAYDIANNGHTQWYEIETDDTIEPFNVELINLSSE